MQQNLTKVIIGLPVYNGEKYVEQAIRSVLSQTFTNFKLIISDNASSDRTEEICRGFAGADCRITYLRRDSNLGAIKQPGTKRIHLNTEGILCSKK